jgi:hypothetical protein
MPHLFSVLTDVRSIAGVQAPRRSTVFEVGSLQLRSGLVSDREVQPFVVSADGQPVLSEPSHSEIDTFTLLTLKTALFPFLFPFGLGAYNGAMTLCNYLGWRMHCFFSVFALQKIYLLMMYQIRQAVILTNTFKHLQIEKSISKFKKTNPGAAEEDVTRKVIKHDVPGSLPGSP